MSEHDVDLLTIYSIRGSRRALQNGEMPNPPIHIQSDLVQFAHFEKALNEFGLPDNLSIQNIFWSRRFPETRQVVFY